MGRGCPSPYPSELRDVPRAIHPALVVPIRVVSVGFAVGRLAKGGGLARRLAGVFALRLITLRPGPIVHRCSPRHSVAPRAHVVEVLAASCGVT